MADKRVILAGSHRSEPVGLEAGGAADPQQQIRVTVMVRRIAAGGNDRRRDSGVCLHGVDVLRWDQAVSGSFTGRSVRDDS